MVRGKVLIRRGKVLGGFLGLRFGNDGRLSGKRRDREMLRLGSGHTDAGRSITPGHELIR